MLLLFYTKYRISMKMCSFYKMFVIDIDVQVFIQYCAFSQKLQNIKIKDLYNNTFET